LQDVEFRQLVEQVKLRSPIEAVVGERVSELRRRGALAWARCPFHEERTPSFAVDPRRGTWRCFGACGEGGDVIRFVERFDGVSFLDALRLLARSAGVEVPEMRLRRAENASEDKLERLHDVLARAARLYSRNFWGDEGREARDYALGRGLSREVLEAFDVGWAPREGNPVLDGAKKSGVDVELLREVGLVKRSEDGRPYDFFRGRWMVPIRDRLGRVVGFGGRILPQDEARSGVAAKYVNTAETALFHKGRLIFGFDLAADAVRRSKHLVLVEGYTDVMAAHQAGHRNVAAVLGTATTEDHAALVRRSGAQRVTLLFDADAAGYKASRKGLLGLLSLGLDLRVATLPEGRDPCDVLVGNGGAEAFQRALDAARDWFDWSVDEVRGLAPAAEAQAVDELFLLLDRLAKPVERSLRLAELARALGIPEADLRAQWRDHETRSARVRAQPAAAKPTRATGPTNGAEAAGAARDGEARAFGALIGALLLDNSLIPLHAERLAACPAGDLRRIATLLLELHERASEEPIHAGTLLTELGDDPARHLVLDLEDEARRAESPQDLARDQELWLERRERERALVDLRAELARSLGARERDGTEDDVLRSLHQELRKVRVPERVTTHDPHA
jgi:DNA primase